MRVSFLYYEDCPSHDLALERLHEVMDEEGIPNKVEVIKVETKEQARELRFIGSPTIRVDGQDIDPPSDSHYALTCRTYRLADGRVSPLPSKDMIQRALRSRRRASLADRQPDRAVVKRLQTLLSHSVRSSWKG